MDLNARKIVYILSVITSVISVDIEIIQTPMVGVTGHDVLKLECTYPIETGGGDVTYEWFHDKNKLEEIHIDNKHTSISIQGHILVIRHITTDYSGRYRCLATNKHGVARAEKMVTVKEIGYFTKGVKSTDPSIQVEVTVNQGHKIKCPEHTTGFGIEYAWGWRNASTFDIHYLHSGYPNSHVFVTSKGNLEFIYITEDDIAHSQQVGGYRCILKIPGYDFYHVSRGTKFELLTTVTNLPQEPILETRIPKEIVVEKGSDVSLVCAATGWPLPKINWQFRGNNLQNAGVEKFEFKEGGMELVLKHLTVGGSIECHAQNRVGTDGQKGEIEIVEAPKFTVPVDPSKSASLNGTLNLEWRVVATPVPTCKWYMNGKTLAVRNFANLTKGPLTIGNTGVYSAVCENKAGIVSRSIYVNVIDAPLEDLQTTHAPVTTASASADHAAKEESHNTVVAVTCVILILIVIVASLFFIRRRRKAYRDHERVHMVDVDNIDDEEQTCGEEAT